MMLSARVSLLAAALAGGGSRRPFPELKGIPASKETPVPGTATKKEASQAGRSTRLFSAIWEHPAQVNSSSPETLQTASDRAC
jgi:hypothetical protein